MYNLGEDLQLILSGEPFAWYDMRGEGLAFAQVYEVNLAYRSLMSSTMVKNGDYYYATYNDKPIEDETGRTCALKFLDDTIVKVYIELDGSRFEIKPRNDVYPFNL